MKCCATCPGLLKYQIGRPPGRLIGGSGGAEPPREKEVLKSVQVLPGGAVVVVDRAITLGGRAVMDLSAYLSVVVVDRGRAC